MKKHNRRIASLILSVILLLLLVPAVSASDGSLTPEGNLTLTDDFTSADGDKQFITVKTEDGDYYYIIIDRAGITQNVYFLKMVGGDEIPGSSGKTPVASADQSCTCTEKCTAGHIDTTCPVCAADSTKCTGKEIVTVPGQQIQQSEKKDNTVPMVGVVLLVAIGGVALYFVFKGKKGSQGEKRTPQRRNEPEEDEDDEFGVFNPDNKEDE